MNRIIKYALGLWSNSKVIKTLIVVLFFYYYSSGEQIENNALASNTNVLIESKLNTLDSLIKAQGTAEDLARIYIDLSWIHLNREGDARQAQRYVEHGDSLAIMLNDTSLMAEVQTIRGRTYNRMGYFSSSLEAHQKAYDLKTALKDTGRMAYSVNQMGRVFLGQKNYAKALEFYLRGMELKKAVKQEQEAFLVFRSISLCYLKLGKYDEARAYAQKARSLVKEGTRRSGKASLTLARVDLEEGYYDQSWELVQEAEFDLSKYGSNLEIADVKIVASQVLLALGRLQEAKTKAQSAYNLAESEDHPVFQIEALEVLHEASIRQEDLSQAYFLNLQIQKTKESFYLKEELTRSLDFETLYRLKERERQIAELEIAKETNLKELALKDRERGILIAALIILLAFIAGLIWYLWFKRRMNLAMIEKDLVIKKQKIKELEQAQKTVRFQALIEGQERERIRLSQELHDGLGGLLSTAKTYLTEQDKTDDNIISIIDQSCKEVREITNNLMPVSLKVIGLTGAIEDLASRIEMMGIECETVLHDIHINDENSRLAIYRIVQELVNNVVKHAHANKLLLQMIQSHNSIHMIIEDDGRGFSLQDEGNGRGLANIQSRLDLLHGSIEFESEKNQGTTVTIEIPMTKTIP